jgi:cyclase
MLAPRIIPCLDVANGRVVKGQQFLNLQDKGDPKEMAARYVAQGADELTFLDVSASKENRDTQYAWVKPVAEVLNIPFTVGGGIRDLKQMRKLLAIGVDKISLSTAAVTNPDLIDEAARDFGSQFVVLSIDTINKEGQWWITIKGGSEITERKLIPWVKEAVDRGIGEILLNVMNTDGMLGGYTLDVTAEVADLVTVPVIASGGVGKGEHIVELFQKTNAQAALAASIFHDGIETVAEVKKKCAAAGIGVRL